MTTITQIFEEITNEMCDNYCKYPGIHRVANDDPESYEAEKYSDLIGIELTDSDYCRYCPLSRL